MISLPWPDKKLTPNSKRHLHWRSYRGAICADREIGKMLTLSFLPPEARRTLSAFEGHIPVEVRFYPPDRRKRDDDGMIGAFKHMRDGIADALGVDDHRFRCTYIVCEPAKPGRVEVRIGG